MECGEDHLGTPTSLGTRFPTHSPFSVFGQINQYLHNTSALLNLHTHTHTHTHKHTDNIYTYIPVHLLIHTNPDICTTNTQTCTTACAQLHRVLSHFKCWVDSSQNTWEVLIFVIWQLTTKLPNLTLASVGY